MTTLASEGAAAALPDASTGTEKPAIAIRHVTKRFGDSIAVDDIDLQLAQGEFFALLGPSGCGKTTTLRMVGGFELPSLGHIYLDGREVTMLPPYKRDVNTVFQSYALFPHLTVFDNVAFGLRRRKVPSAEIRDKVERHLEMVGLAGYGKRRPLQLSGGQQQRVALARSLVNEPKVLLLDEPMGALDAKIRKSMQLELKRIQREVGITFLYVTHDQNEAMSMADRLAVMNAGRTEDIGTPDRVYDRPATRFVAEFLGTCNVIAPESGADGLRLPDGTPLAVESAQVRLPAGARVGIRPEKFVVTRADISTTPTGTVNSVRGRVVTATYLGASTEYEVTAPWGGVLKAFAQNLADSSRARPGEEVVLTWDASHAFVLAPSPEPTPVAVEKAEEQAASEPAASSRASEVSR
ncbi:ABC transporter ATP-binding protein [Humibacter albus]|uniref:ABC transporter ATP-binding protein n=1 Tax=Humibacter albus TaxID=427754 RepID=UPI0003B599F9|nr:ABC transporter ATP-binding protein [Humibacter albus]